MNDGGRPSGSFLVRLWVEPTRESAETPGVRGYVRDLKTGEESYSADLRALLDRMVFKLEQQGEKKSRADSAPDVSSASSG